MNSEKAVVVGWAEPLEQGQQAVLKDLETKLGGSPLWLQEAGEASQSDVDGLKCDKCGEPLKFLMQVAPQALAGVCTHRGT